MKLEFFSLWHSVHAATLFTRCSPLVCFSRLYKVFKFFIGVVLYFISIYPQISDLWKLFLITGLLGGLTTFSSFSAEVFTLMQENKWANAFFVTFFHLVGSISMTALGFVTASFLKKIF